MQCASAEQARKDPGLSVKARAKLLRQRSCPSACSRMLYARCKGFIQLHTSKAWRLADVLQDLGLQGRCVHLHPLHERLGLANHRRGWER